MPRRCCIATCKSPDQRAHRIPVSRPRTVKKWVEALQRPELLDLPVGELKKYTVCTKHFVKQDYVNISKWLLARDSVPSLYLHNDLDSDKSSKDTHAIMIKSEPISPSYCQEAVPNSFQEAMELSELLDNATEAPMDISTFISCIMKPEVHKT